MVDLKTAMSGQAEWKYEWEKTDSTQQDRVIFFESIQRFKPKTVRGLLELVYPGFVPFLEQVLSNQLRFAPQPTETWRDSFRRLRRIPELEIRRFDWNALCEIKSSEGLRNLVLHWATLNHIAEKWVYDFAVRVMISWLYNRQISWDGIRTQSPKVLHDNFVPWSEELRKMEYDLEASRVCLSLDLFPKDPPPFTFEDWFQYPGWNYLDQGKRKWISALEKRFQETIASQRLRGNPSPSGILSRLRREVSAYLKEQDSKRLADVESHRLTKRPRSFAISHKQLDHLDWLVKYQIPECWDYAKIAEESKIGKDTIRKEVKKAADSIRLTLRPTLKPGRPPGVKEKTRRRRSRTNN